MNPPELTHTEEAELQKMVDAALEQSREQREPVTMPITVLLNAYKILDIVKKLANFLKAAPLDRAHRFEW